MNDVERIAQTVFSTRIRHQGCRRAVCLRNRICVPPRSPLQPTVFRCPHDSEADWQMRFAAVQKLGERMRRMLERKLAARGQPSPFAPPSEPDPLDIDTPLDFDALFRPESLPAG